MLKSSNLSDKPRWPWVSQNQRISVNNTNPFLVNKKRSSLYRSSVGGVTPVIHRRISHTHEEEGLSRDKLHSTLRFVLLKLRRPHPQQPKLLAQRRTPLNDSGQSSTDQLRLVAKDPTDPASPEFNCKLSIYFIWSFPVWSAEVELFKGHFLPLPNKVYSLREYRSIMTSNQARIPNLPKNNRCLRNRRFISLRIVESEKRGKRQQVSLLKD